MRPRSLKRLDLDPFPGFLLSSAALRELDTRPIFEGKEPMSLVTPLGQDHDLLMIRATEIDDQDLLGRIRESLAKCAPLTPVAAALGRARMSEKRQQILTSINALQER